MIPAPPGLIARYGSGATPDHRERPVVAFDNDGYPLVLGGEGNRQVRLVRADSLSDYNGIYPCVVAMIPGGGWRVEFTSEYGVMNRPLVGWGLRSNGAVVALDTDDEGDVDWIDPMHRVPAGDTRRIFHPHAFEPPPTV